MKTAAMNLVRLPSRICVAALLSSMLLAGCKEPAPEATPPPAAEVDDEASGYYCGMLLMDHTGPKGQVHLASRDSPIWFSSVRDTIVFLRLPEEPRDVVAVYVNDMGAATNWDHPEPGTWIDARTAWYVLNSTRRGGMGAAEAVPFSTEAAADAFRSRHGGQVARLDQIPDDYVIGSSSGRPVHPAGHGSDSQPTH